MTFSSHFPLLHSNLIYKAICITISAMIDASLDERLKNKGSAADLTRPSPRKKPDKRYAANTGPYQEFIHLYAFGNGVSGYSHIPKGLLSPYLLLVSTLFPGIAAKGKNNAHLHTVLPQEQFQMPSNVQYLTVYHPQEELEESLKRTENLSSVKQNIDEDEGLDSISYNAVQRAEELSSSGSSSQYSTPGISDSLKSYWKLLGSYVKTDRERIFEDRGNYVSSVKRKLAYANAKSNYRPRMQKYKT